MSIADVRLLVKENGRRLPLPVFPGQDGITDPAERVYIALREENLAPVLFQDAFALPYNAKDGEDGYGKCANLNKVRRSTLK